MIMEKQEKNYRIVDFNSWNGANKFKYFMNVEKCIITVTANVDVTELVTKCKAHGLKFYTAFICLVSYVLNSREHFRFGYDKDHNVVIYDSISPFYTDSVTGSESFNCIMTEYSSDMNKLYKRISLDRERHKAAETLVSDNLPDNIFNVTALPRVHYTQLDLNDASRPDSLAPAIAVGKYELHEGRMQMPLTLWIHHAVCDGFHVGQFFADVEEQIPKILNEIIN